MARSKARATAATAPFDGAWLAACLELAARVRQAARGALLDALDAPRRGAGPPSAWLAPEGQGAGDVTYGLDRAAEAVLSAWLDERARVGALSLFTEDHGWRHAGPRAGGGARELADFDHGGPRLVVDPVDGTRNLMSDLRPAWTAIAFTGAGAHEPRLADVTGGVLAEIPDSRGARLRVLHASAGLGAQLEQHDLSGRALAAPVRLAPDGDARLDHGYFPFFRYAPDLRPDIARVEAAFFERLARLEGADVRNCWDDQYIASAGQLALLALGQYRMVVDLRPLLAARRGIATQPSKPYDVAGAILVAREAGCVVVHPEGGALDFPLDATTPVAFAGFHGAATAERCLPHLLAALG